MRWFTFRRVMTGLALIALVDLSMLIGLLWGGKCAKNDFRQRVKFEGGAVIVADENVKLPDNFRDLHIWYPWRTPPKWE